MSEMANEREDFRKEMASIIISRYSMKAGALTAVEKWADWDDLFNAGFRKKTSGDAYREWQRGL